MRRMILGFLGTVMAVWTGLALLGTTPVMALEDSCDAPEFLGFRPWYAGLCEGNEIRVPQKDDEAGLTRFIWIIVLNVLFDLMLAVGYLAIGFIIYGGYLYIMSQGDPARTARGKKTLTSAIVGTVIALLASVAVNTVRVILGINGSDGWNQGGFGQEQVQNAFNWAYSMAGIIAVIFIVKASFDYVMSRGDPGKTKLAMQGIIYAVVGLVVVLLAAAITTFVIGAVNGAGGA